MIAEDGEDEAAQQQGMTPMMPSTRLAMAMPDFFGGMPRLRAEAGAPYCGGGGGGSE